MPRPTLDVSATVAARFPKAKGGGLARKMLRMGVKDQYDAQRQHQRLLKAQRYNAAMRILSDPKAPEIVKAEARAYLKSVNPPRPQGRTTDSPESSKER